MAHQNDKLDFSGLFKLDVLIHLKISSYSFYELGLKKLISLASDNEFIFIYINPLNERAEKKNDWNFIEDPVKCMCFEPTGTWLLVVSEQKVILLPFMPLFVSQDTFDLKWSLENVTTIPVRNLTNATSVVWWSTKESENIVIIGSKNGSIMFFSLDAQCVVGESKVTTAIIDLQICFDDSLDLLSLIIIGTNSQQWKLILEHRSLNYNWLQQCHSSPQDKDKKEGFMSYIRQLSKDKITLFSQGTSKDDSKSQAAEYTVKPMEYLPAFRKGSNNWALNAQYANGHHFLTALEVNEGILILECSEEDIPSRALRVNVPSKSAYQQGLWSQRLIYLLKKNEVEVHSVGFSTVQGDPLLNANTESTLIWSSSLIGDVKRAFLVSTKEPSTSMTGWREPTFMCDLQLPRFNLDACLIITNRGAFMLNTICSACEWLVGVIMRGGVGAERAAAALGAPVGSLLKASADMLLSRGKIPPAQYLYSLSQCPQDGWLARLGVFGRLDELSDYKQPYNNMPNLGSSALILRLLAHLAKYTYNQESKFDINRKLSNLNAIELEELCCFSTSVGLWDLVPTFSIYQGQPKLLLNAMKNRPSLCCGALNLLLRQKNLVPLLEEDGQFIFDFINANCNLFDYKLLKRLCIWLCPLQDQFRPVLRDLRQGITTPYTSQMQELINTFMHIVSTLEKCDPSHDISTTLKEHADTWKRHFTFKRSISCGLAHWAVADGGNAKVLLANTPIKTDLIGRVISVACGRHHTLVLTENGVYSTGDNTYGQLGIGMTWPGSIGDSAITSGELVHVPFAWSAPLITVAAGHYHSAAIDVGGLLYTWGWGVHGQLGLGSIDDECSPRLVTRLQGRKVLSVGCGSCHTAALMKNGEVWCWGAGVFGQLGSGHRTKSSVPVRLILLDPVTQIAIGHFHNLGLTVKGEVWIWGASPQSVRAAHARRQNSPPSPPEPPSDCDPHLAPSLVDTRHISGSILQISAGWHHSCLLTNSGMVYTWGLNFDGQLGSGDRKQVPTPAEVKFNIDIPADSLSSESSSSFSRKVISMKTSSAQGLSDDGTLGEVTRKALIACGGDYTVFIDDEGRMFITGNTHKQVQNDLGKPGNRVIMMKTTKRVIKIPANKSNNKFMFQYVDRIDNWLSTANVERDPIDRRPNPLATLSTLKEKSWIDEVIILLKPWINENCLSTNFNMLAKLAFHKESYTECLKYLLKNINQKVACNIVYLKHSDPNKSGSKDLQTSIKEQEVRVSIKNVLAKRIKEIGLTILNDQPYPKIHTDIYKGLPCCCDELMFMANNATNLTQPECSNDNIIVKSADIIDKCISMFPIDSDLWQLCFDIAKCHYIENNLPIDGLESILFKYMQTDPMTMASATMFSKDCTQYSKILSPKFFLYMCNEVMDTWS